MAGKAILVVEDDGILVTRLHDLLLRAGYSVPSPVASGEAALAAVAAGPPDLVLMDITLAGALDGATTAMRIRADFDIPIVFLTAYSLPAQLEQAKTASPYGYLIKPVVERELLATLEMALHRHALDCRLKDSEERLGLALWGADLSLWDWDLPTDTITCQGPWVEWMSGQPGELQLPYRAWERHIHPQDLPAVRAALESYLQGDTPFWESEYRWRVKEGAGWHWLFLRGKGIDRDGRKPSRRVCGVIMNISDRKRLEEELRRLATTDTLTGVFNRHYLLEAMATETKRARRHGRPLSLIMFDLDHFKRINDTFGHERGDAALIQVTVLVKERLRHSDILARWGGEEFIILAPETALSQALTLTETLQSELRRSPVAGLGPVTASFGVAQYLEDETSDQWLKRVDALVYRAKHAGRDQVSHRP